MKERTNLTQTEQKEIEKLHSEGRYSQGTIRQKMTDKFPRLKDFRVWFTPQEML